MHCTATMQLGRQRRSHRSSGLVVGVAGDPGIDLCPGPFQPWAQLVGLRKHTLRPRPHRLFSCVRLQYELADAGQTYGVNVAVTSVDARNVKFDIKVDDQPKP